MKPFSMRRTVDRERTRGFTLVELLVVIAIIAILVALFIPILSKVKERTRITQCTANVKELTNALAVYVSEHNGKVFGYYENELSWMAFLSPYHADLDTVRICPKTTVQTRPGNGSDELAWHYSKGNYSGSYGLNGWFYSIENLEGGAGNFGRNGYPLNFWRNMDQAAANTPLFTESAWYHGWPNDRDAVPGNTRGDVTESFGRQMGRFVVDRHPKKSVVSSFSDGHVELVPLKMLWDLRWHAKFEPRGEMNIP